MAKFAQSVFYKGGVQKRGAGNARRGKVPGTLPCPVHTLANTDESSMNR
jgi:hypothetical protein